MLEHHFLNYEYTIQSLNVYYFNNALELQLFSTATLLSI